MSQDRKSHWEGVYDTKQFADVSWYQPVPVRSLEMIAAACLARDAPIIDVGGGASTLVDHLIDAEYLDITVLDVSGRALAQARDRLGERADRVTWQAADVTAFQPGRTYSLWHDRAVLHFLVEADDRRRYVEALRSALAPGGHLVLATFGPDGPLQCSGLAVRRYSVSMMEDLLGPGFELCAESTEFHETPSGGLQQFLYAHWRRQTP